MSLDTPRGSIVCRIGNQEYTLPPGPDSWILTADSNAADGSGLLYATALPITLSVTALDANIVGCTGTVNADAVITIHDITAGGALKGASASITNTLSAQTVTAATASLAGSIGVNGATPPLKAAFPGTADGVAADDATVLNNVIAILVNLGFCASS